MPPLQLVSWSTFSDTVLWVAKGGTGGVKQNSRRCGKGWMATLRSRGIKTSFWSRFPGSLASGAATYSASTTTFSLPIPHHQLSIKVRVLYFIVALGALARLKGLPCPCVQKNNILTHPTPLSCSAAVSHRASCTSVPIYIVYIYIHVICTD